MRKKVIGIIGSYRKGKVIDTALSKLLEGAEANNAETEKIYLIDRNINFCINCRSCTQNDPDKNRGVCIHKDDMNSILESIEQADAIVLASPINFSTVTAVMKKFVERLIVYAYWPWDKPAPKIRNKTKTKKAVIITSSACPAFIGKFMMPNCLSVLKMACGVLGAKVIKKFYFGGLSPRENIKLPKKLLDKAYVYGQKLAD